MEPIGDNYRAYKVKITCPFCGWSREIPLTKYPQQKKADYCRRCGLDYAFERVGWKIAVRWEQVVGVSEKARKQIVAIGEGKAKDGKVEE